jgi:hypothetical protein
VVDHAVSDIYHSFRSIFHLKGNRTAVLEFTKRKEGFHLDVPPSIL